MGQFYKILLDVKDEKGFELSIPNGLGTEFVDNPDGTHSEIKHQEYVNLVSGEEKILFLDDEAIRFIMLFPYEAINKDHSFYISPVR